MLTLNRSGTWHVGGAVGIAEGVGNGLAVGTGVDSGVAVGARGASGLSRGASSRFGALGDAAGNVVGDSVSAISCGGM